MIKETKDAHECKYMYGQITDCLFSEPCNFSCRRCGRDLLKTQVNKDTYDKFVKDNNERNKFKSR
jgi:hypothetical protein